MSQSGAASPLDASASLFDEWKYGPGKNISIVRSSSSVISIAASALLVWILFRSRDGMKAATYNRLLLGLSVSDILFSLSTATFGAAAPGEMSYVVWNARGGRESCDALGFLNALGAFGGVIYMCSLNFYYLAKVKYNKTDCYIAKKLEPWLHGVPIFYGLILSIVLLAKQRMNASIDGVCSATNAYDPPHCNGYEGGDIPEGFAIPCGRGNSAEPIIFVTAFITIFLVPVAIGSSLWIIYRSVLRTERRISRYGAGALQTNRAQPTSNDASRAVLHKAAAYSVAYFLTYIWRIIIGVVYLAGAWTFDLPQPKWQIAYLYALNFFQPLQGLWTFLIYMQPDVVKRKRSSDGTISWLEAFADALRSAIAGRNNSAGRGRNRADPGRPRPRGEERSGHRRFRRSTT